MGQMNSKNAQKKKLVNLFQMEEEKLNGDSLTIGPKNSGITVIKVT